LRRVRLATTRAYCEWNVSMPTLHACMHRLCGFSCRMNAPLRAPLQQPRTCKKGRSIERTFDKFVLLALLFCKKVRLPCTRSPLPPDSRPRPPHSHQDVCQLGRERLPKHDRFAAGRRQHRPTMRSRTLEVEWAAGRVEVPRSAIMSLSRSGGAGGVCISGVMVCVLRMALLC
jgi:hypothetical protein